MVGTIYSKVTGEIYTAMYGPDKESIEIQLPLYEDSAYLLGEFLESDEWYLPSGVKTHRPEMKLKVSAKVLPVNETLVISGIPENTTVIAGNDEYLITDGKLEWSSAVSTENFTFEFSCFPYKHKVVNIAVTKV